MVSGRCAEQEVLRTRSQVEQLGWPKTPAVTGLLLTLILGGGHTLRPSLGEPGATPVPTSASSVRPSPTHPGGCGAGGRFQVSRLREYLTQAGAQAPVQILLLLHDWSFGFPYRAHLGEWSRCRPRQRGPRTGSPLAARSLRHRDDSTVTSKHYSTLQVFGD